MFDAKREKEEKRKILLSLNRCCGRLLVREVSSVYQSIFYFIISAIRVVRKSE